jgi:hypothetical protein
MNPTAVARSFANVMVTASEADDRLAWAREIHDWGVSRAGRFVCVFPAKKHQLCAVDVDEWFARAASTVFIDCVGNLGADAQERLLQRLTEQSRLAIGTATSHRTRVITGSDRSLSADVASGIFSDELFYRLNVIHIDLAHHYVEPGEHL